MAQPQRKSQHAIDEDVASRQAPLRVVEGRAPRAKTATRSALNKTFYTALVCVMLMSAFAGVRVYLAAQTSVATIETSKIKVKLNDEYLRASDLEVQQSKLAQSDRIKAYAQTKLDMGPARSVSHIDVGAPPAAQVVADLPDDAFDNTPRNDGGPTAVTKFIRSIFSPAEAGATVVSQP